MALQSFNISFEKKKRVETFRPSTCSLLEGALPMVFLPTSCPSWCTSSPMWWWLGRIYSMSGRIALLLHLSRVWRGRQGLKEKSHLYTPILKEPYNFLITMLISRALESTVFCLLQTPYQPRPYFPSQSVHGRGEVDSESGSPGERVGRGVSFCRNVCLFVCFYAMPATKVMSYCNYAYWVIIGLFSLYSHRIIISLFSLYSHWIINNLFFYQKTVL